MIVKLLTKHHLEFLSLKGGCRGSSESTHVKMPHGWKSHALAQIIKGPNVLVSFKLGSQRTLIDSLSTVTPLITLGWIL